jgi:hypothetical protein
MVHNIIDKGKENKEWKGKYGWSDDMVKDCAYCQLSYLKAETSFKNLPQFSKLPFPMQF